MGPWRAAAVASLLVLSCARPSGVTPSGRKGRAGTEELVARVDAAAQLLSSKGEAAFAEFRKPDSRWRRGEDYVFVLDLQGDMLVHPDPALEGKNELELKDINGRPIIRGLLAAVTAVPGRTDGWYHYQWPVPGGLLPRWKSSYAKLVTAPAGQRYVVASGIYDDTMARPFVIDIVEEAVSQIESRGRAAFPRFYDPTGPFLVKDAYVFVIDRNGVDLVNPAFPSIEGRNLLEQKDTRGKPFVRDMIQVAESQGSGWVDYLWPKPGESVSTQKSAFVRRAKLDGDWVVVGCGAYLADAPREPPDPTKPTARGLVELVRDGAALLGEKGEAAYPDFRQRGSRWFRDDTYFFVWTMDGTRVFFAPDPALEGDHEAGLKDVLGRPVGRMILDAAASPSGEGWVHYMYPKPGDIFPAWKSTFVKRVSLPSGEPRLIGAGVYDMQLDEVMVEDLVNRAAELIAEQGRDAFPQLRDKKGPFVFMDTYVFVDAVNGTELVNAVQPSIEGMNLIDARDAKGKLLVRDYIDAALRNGSAWVSYYWFKPGENAPSPKRSFVKKVEARGETFVVGAGLYPE
jgi:signal transduction histidine kinase